jgi:hypothetical protein
MDWIRYEARSVRCCCTACNLNQSPATYRHESIESIFRLIAEPPQYKRDFEAVLSVESAQIRPVSCRSRKTVFPFDEEATFFHLVEYLSTVQTVGRDVNIPNIWCQRQNAPDQSKI